MKLSKTSWIFLGVGAFLIAAVILGWTYLQLLDQQQQTAARLTLAQKSLTGMNFVDLVEKRDSLAQQADKSASDITNTQNKLSSSKDSIDATNAILADAKACNANITNISSPGLGAEDLAGIKCETLSISIDADGNLQILSRFISSLSQIFPTSVVKSVKIYGPGNFSAKIELVIYNYKGN